MAMAVISRMLVLAMLGLVPFAYLYAIGARLSASIDDDGFHYQGWFRASDILWRDVVSVKTSNGLPYPQNRFYGPMTYVIETGNDRVAVNMLFFSRDFNRAFHKATTNLGPKPENLENP